MKLKRGILTIVAIVSLLVFAIGGLVVLHDFTAATIQDAERCIYDGATRDSIVAVLGKPSWENSTGAQWDLADGWVGAHFDETLRVEGSTINKCTRSKHWEWRYRKWLTHFTGHVTLPAPFDF